MKKKLPIEQARLLLDNDNPDKCIQIKEL